MIDIIVPVFNAAPDLKRCLQSLLEFTDEGSRYLMVNDASTDPLIAPMLDDFATQRPHAKIISNPSNLGFVGSTNQAMSQSGNDVVLLNSDTQVTSGWLTALLRCAQSDSTIATATPFSNNAEICSLPEFCVNNPLPENPALWSAAVTSTASRKYPEIPTGVGFCMYVRRQALDEIGLFDPCFGRGYGEENDWCRRAANAGWRNVLCDDAFVAHAGGRSFAPINIAPNGDNLKLLLDRHPDYMRRVSEFIETDPIKPIRLAIMKNYLA